MTDTLLVYLAGPIDGVEDGGETVGARLSIKIALERQGHVVFDPMNAFSQVAGLGMKAKPICSINRNAIRLCDVMVVSLMGPGRAFGTIREIEYARSMDMPVVVVSDQVPLLSLEAHDIRQVGYDNFIENKRELHDLIKQQ